MAGFPLMAIGAGIGQAAKAYQEQQEARQRTMMLQLQLQRWQREEQEQRIKDEAAGGTFNLDNPLGGGGISPVGPGMGGASLSPSGGGESMGGGVPSASSFMGTGGPPQRGGMQAGGAMMGNAGEDPRLALIRKYESEGRYNVGWGGTDLSNAPPDQFGFPQWPGKMGPAGNSRAAGAYQFQPGTWRQYAEPMGIKDFSPASQDAVGAAALRDQGTKPWAPYNPRLAAALARGEGAESSPQMGQAQPGAAAPQPQGTAAGINVPPPERVDWTQIARAARQQNQNMSPRAFSIFMDTVQKRMGEDYKQRYEQWKTEQSFRFEGARNVETGRHNLATEGLTASGQAETGRANLATEGDRARQRQQQDVSLGYEGQRVAETGRSNLATESDRGVQRGQERQRIGLEGERVDLTRSGQVADINDKGRGRDLEAGRLQVSKDVAEGRRTKVEGEQQLAVTQMRGIADRARDLLDAVDQNPNLVGTIGQIRRYTASAAEQAKLAQYDKQQAEYRSAVKLLQAEAQKPLLGSRYFTKAGMEEIQKLIPSLDKWDSPTEVKAALRGLAMSLERKAQETEAVMGGVKKDYQGLSNEDLLKQLGVPSAGAQQ